MVSVLFLIFGALDLVGGMILTFGSVTLLPEIARYLGIFLMIKGVYTLFTSLAT